MDKIAGYLEAGIVWVPSAYKYDVMVNFPATENDTPHHVSFSPNQARQFAQLLLKKADEADTELPK